MNTPTTHRRWLVLALALSACAGEDTTDPYGETSDTIVIDDHDFILLTQLEAANSVPTANQIDALYGRATGLVGPSLCSGFLIDDAVFASARHCRMNDDGVVVVGTASTFTAGQYGLPSSSNPASFPSANLDAFVRGLQIGIPLSAILSGQVPFASLTTWNCNVTQVTPGRDVEYHTCAPNVVVWNEPNGNTVVMNLLPGHIWGHFNAAAVNPSDGEDVRNFGINPRCGDPVRSVITAPGEIIDEDNSCSGDFDHCFEHDADTIQGHSGGPVMRRSDHLVYGVQNGTQILPHDLPDTDDPCGSATGWTSENRAAKIGSDITTITGSAPTGNAEPTGPYMGIGGLLGAYGGTSRTLTCPANYLAAGVIGSTATSGHLGTFGLVRMPNRDSFGVGSVGFVTTHRLDRAVVVATSSQDTGFLATFGTDFNTYFNERLSSTSSAPFQQRLQMCPPGMFLRSISGTEAGYVGEVSAITCAQPLASASTVTRQVSGMGNFDSANDPALTDATSACTGTGAFISGLYSYSSSQTWGLRARCRRAW